MTNNYTWNERYRSDRYGLEQKSSFRYFQMYLKEHKPRNLKEFHNKLSDRLSTEEPGKRVPSYQTIRDYSHKWKWNPRAEAYDDYIQNTDDEELKAIFKEIKKETLQNSKSRIQHQNELFNEIMDNEDLTTKEKIYAGARNSEAYNNEIKSVNEVYNEGKDIQEIDADLSTNSVVDIQPKSVFEELEELDAELSAVYDDGETKQDQEKQ